MSSSAWYLILIRPEGKNSKEQIRLPPMGSTVSHKFAEMADDEVRQNKVKESNPFWDLFQDDHRPIWAPDFFRLGYAIVWKREGLPKQVLKLGLRNPEHKAPGFQGKKRVLMFDDVWAIPVIPVKTPMALPDMALKGAQWWDQLRNPGKIAQPYLAPGGVKVMGGAQRLSDVVYTMINGYHMQSDDTLLSLKDDEFSNIMTTYAPEVDESREGRPPYSGGPGGPNRTRQAHTPIFRTAWGSPYPAEFKTSTYGYGLFWASTEAHEDEDH